MKQRSSLQILKCNSAHACFHTWISKNRDWISVLDFKGVEENIIPLFGWVAQLPIEVWVISNLVDLYDFLYGTIFTVNRVDEDDGDDSNDADDNDKIIYLWT